MQRALEYLSIACAVMEDKAAWANTKEKGPSDLGNFVLHWQKSNELHGAHAVSNHKTALFQPSPIIYWNRLKWCGF